MFVKRIKACLFCFCSFMCVLCFFYVWNLSVKKTKKFKTALVTSFTLLLIKKLFLPIKTAIFTNSEQSKTPFGRNSVNYRTPCHARGHFVFYCYHVTYRTPCRAIGLLVIFTVSAADLRERFLLSGVFYLTLLPASFKSYLRPEV